MSRPISVQAGECALPPASHQAHAMARAVAASRRYETMSCGSTTLPLVTTSRIVAELSGAAKGSPVWRTFTQDRTPAGARADQHGQAAAPGAREYRASSRV